MGRSLRLTFLAATLLTLTLAVAITPPTSAGDIVRAKAAHYGYALEEREISPEIGWTDHPRDTIVLEDDLSPSVRVAVGLHEVGHARQKVHPITSGYWRTARRLYHGTAHSVLEDHGWVYSYCIAPQPGVGYSWHPDNPRPPTPAECDAI